MSDQDNVTNSEMLDALEIDSDSIGKCNKHNYRVKAYDRLSVEYLEKITMEKMLDENLAGPYSDTFLMKSYVLFPERFPELANKKKRGKKSSNYFIEDVGKYLWQTWKDTGSIEARNDFLTYCYPLIDGVIFKYQRHKHGLAYEEIFQSALIKLIHAIDKFDPMRVVGVDEKGNKLYARVFTYVTLVMNYACVTITMAHGSERITNVSLDSGMSQYYDAETSAMTDAPIIFQEFLAFLDALSEMQDDLITDSNRLIMKTLRRLLDSPKDASRIANNLIMTLKNESGLKIKDVTDALELVRTVYGPLNICSQVIKPQEAFADFE